jgi:hypothetical protein
VPTPDDLYWQASRHGSLSASPSLERVEQLREAAATWTAQGSHFAAGMAYSAVTDAGSGLLERAPRLECVRAAMAAFRIATERSQTGSLDGLVAYKKWSDELRHLDYDGLGQGQQQRDAEPILTAHAERLVSQFSEHPQADSFLVRGYQVLGPVTGPWVPEFPDREVDDSSHTWHAGERVFCLSMPSAFQLLVRLGDYRAAREICQRRPIAFTSPGLRGWRMAVDGFVDSKSASQFFRAAAQAFDEDTLERAREMGVGWTSANRDLWAPFFRSRSWMAHAVCEPARAEECISAAAACMPERRYGHTGVHRYHLFVRALAGVLDLAHGLTESEARQGFQAEIAWFGETKSDPAVLEFLHHARAGFDRLRGDRLHGLTSVGRAMAALDRVPLLGNEEAEAVRAVVDRRAAAIVEGPNRIWMHRSLEEIGNERRLRHTLLRLFQNSLPRYAQVRHGPIEYGKDIVVVAEERGELVMRMYQAKCGDIKKRDWNENVRPQLEEMFQVPLETFQVPAHIRRRVGILVWNGHADPHVEPVMQAWKQDQLNAFHREYEFMHLDDIVRYVFENRLVTALRQAVEEGTVDQECDD